MRPGRYTPSAVPPLIANSLIIVGEATRRNAFISSWGGAVQVRQREAEPLARGLSRIALIGALHAHLPRAGTWSEEPQLLQGIDAPGQTSSACRAHALADILTSDSFCSDTEVGLLPSLCLLSGLRSPYSCEFLLRHCLYGGKPDTEGRALLRNALHIDPAAILRDESAADGKAQTNSLQPNLG